MSKNSSKRNVKKNNKRLSTTQKIDTKKINEAVDKSFESVKKIKNTTLKSVNKNSNVKFKDTEKFDNTKVIKNTGSKSNSSKNNSKGKTTTVKKNTSNVRDNIIVSVNDKKDNVKKEVKVNKKLSNVDTKKVDTEVKDNKDNKFVDTKKVDAEVKDSKSSKKVNDKREEIIVADLSDQVTDSTIKLNKLRDEIYSLYDNSSSDKNDKQVHDDTIVAHESFLSTKGEEVEILEEKEKLSLSSKFLKALIIILSIIFIGLLIFNIWMVIYIITF